MSKNITRSMLFLTLAAISFCANAQTERQVRYVTQYGDAMGFYSNETATKRTEYLYDAKNRLARKVQTGLLADGSWLLTYDYRQDYNAQGLLEMTNSLQYGAHDQGEYGFSVSKDTLLYEYDEAGRVIKMSEPAKNQYYTYAYDENGNKVKEERWNNNYSTGYVYAVTLTITYSDFVNGNPETWVADATSSYNCYTAKADYDAQGRKLAEKQWYTDGTLKSAEYWTYDDNGNLELYEKKAISSGKEIDGTKTVYEQQDANNTRYSSYSYNTNTQTWNMKAGSIYVTNYADYDAQTAPTLTAQVDDKNSTTVHLSVTVPQGVENVRIYRNGLVVSEGQVTDGQYVCDETEVMIGDHEYWAQAIVNGESANISNIAKVTISRTFPRATGVHATTAYKNSNGSYIVTLAWTNPQIPEDLTYVATNVMRVTSYGSTEELRIDDATTTSGEVNLGIDTEARLYVQTQYSTGRAASDTISVDATKLIGKVSDENRRLRVVETIGDSQGAEYGICTKKDIYFYGPDNRILRFGHYGKNLGTDLFLPMEYTCYEYGENGQLEKSYTQQYGTYDYTENGFKDAQDTTYYEFNLEGQKIREENAEGYTTYTYDTNGNLTQTYSLEHATNDLEQTITYSDFAGQDKPRLTVSDGTLSSYKYQLETTYDENGNVVDEMKSKWQTSTESYKHDTYTLHIYDDQGTLMADSVYTVKTVNDVETYTLKSYTSYTAEENNPNRITVIKYVYDSILKKFGNPKTWEVWEYTDIDGDKYAPTLTVEPVIGKANTVKLTVDVPSAQAGGMTALNIYRHGIEIAHGLSYTDDNYYQTDEYGFNGVWSYEDTDVKNGGWDYYVELAKLSSDLSSEASVHNISNVVRYDFNLQLPAPTNLTLGTRRQTTSSYQDDETGETMTQTDIFYGLSWDAPTDTIGLGFKGYEIYRIEASVPENYPDLITDTQYELALMGRDSVDVYVMAVYTYGRAASEAIHISAADAIQAISADATQNQWYDLQGRPTVAPRRGVFVTKGKKYIIK